MVLVACNECRRRKVRCDGLRPRCSRCTSRKLSCEYDTGSSETTRARQAHLEQEKLKGEMSKLRASLNALARRSPSEASALLRQLGAANDPTAALLQLNSGDASVAPVTLPRQPSRLAAVRSVLPKTDSWMELELYIHHRSAYPPLPVVDLWAYSTEPSALSWATRRTIVMSLLGEISASPRELVSAATTLLPEPPTPHNAQNDIDIPRLRNMDIRRWTSVPITNALAIQAMSIYFMTEHPLLGLFDANLFIQDLTSSGTSFCSSILVNALLFYALASCSHNNKNAMTIKHACLEEVQLALAVMDGPMPILCVPALQLLCSGCVFDGRFEQGKEFLRMALVQTAYHKIFGHPNNFVDEPNILDPDQLRSISCIAWGSFAYLAIWELYNRDNTLQRPPSLPKPWDLTRSSVEFETVDEPFTANSLSSDVVFEGICKLWLIFSDIVLFYKSDERLTEDAEHVFVESTYHRLLELADHLPASLRQKSQMTDSAASFRICFHLVVLELLRPVVKRNPPLRSFNASDSSPRAAFSSSFKQLKRLILIYRFNFESAVTSLLWHGGLVFIADATLKYDHADDAAYTFRHCISALSDLRPAFGLMELTLRGFLLVAVKSSVMTLDEARSVLRATKPHPPQRALGAIKGGFVLDHELALVNPEQARVQRFTDEWQELEVFDEFVVS